MVSIFPDTPAPLLVLGSHQPGGRGGGCIPHLLLAGEVGCVRSYSSLARLVEPVCEAVCVSCERPEGDVSLVFLWLRYPWVSVSSYDKVVTSPSFSHLLAGAFVCCWMTAGSVDVGHKPYLRLHPKKMIQKKSGVRATVSLSFQVRARGSNTQLTLKKWADASSLGTGPPQRLLATRKSRCFRSTGLNHQDKILLKGNCFCKGRSSRKL